MFKTYVLNLVDGSYYVGSTGNLEERLEEHKNRKVKSTKNKLPFKLVHEESFQNRSEAQSREYQIKKWKSREAIERMIKKRKQETSLSFNG